jgi:hypothetical protein
MTRVLLETEAERNLAKNLDEDICLARTNILKYKQIKCDMNKIKLTADK